MTLARPKVAVVSAVELTMNKLLAPQLLALEGAGFDVHAICSPSPKLDSLQARGITVHPVEISRKLRPHDDVRTLMQLVALFRRERFSAVHTHTPKAAFLGLLAARIANVPLRLNTVHGLYYLSASGIRRRLFKALEIAACRWAHIVLSQSQEDTDLLKASPWLDSRRVHWLGNGIDLSRFNPERFSGNTRQEVRQELGLPMDAFVVGIVARPVVEKGLRELFAAIAKLRQSVTRTWLLHIGSTYGSRDREITLEDARAVGIAENLVQAGHRDDIARLMTAMEVYALPSYREGYPRSVMEANAMGLPVVVTDIRGCREAVDDGVNGLLVPARQVEPLAEALIRLAEDDELRATLSQGARRIAEHRFDERQVIRRVLDCYRPLLPAGGTSIT